MTVLVTSSCLVGFLAWLLRRPTQRPVAAAWERDKRAAQKAVMDATAVSADVRRLVDALCEDHETRERKSRPYPVADFIQGDRND